MLFIGKVYRVERNVDFVLFIWVSKYLGGRFKSIKTGGRVGFGFLSVYKIEFEMGIFRGGFFCIL